MRQLTRIAAEQIPVAELAKSFGRPGESPKVLATSATEAENPSAARLTHQKRSSTPRGGVVLMIALVLLLVFSMMLLGMIRGLGAGMRQATQASRQHQSVWLANAGLERAAFRIREDGEYTGERWEITADQLAAPIQPSPSGAPQAELPVAIVEIEVEKVAGSENRRQVVVTADYPAAVTFRVRTQKSAMVDLTP